MLSLAYFASPIRFLVRQTIGVDKTNLLPPILGALALCAGIALLFFTRQKTRKNTEI
jgi:hypothetical protein